MAKRKLTEKQKEVLVARLAKARAAKKAKKEAVAKVEKPKGPAFMVEIIKRFFPEAGIKITDRGNDYLVEITLKEAADRAFVVDKLTAKIETSNWCAKIENSLKGKPAKTVSGIGLQTGVRSEMKKMPPNLGKDKEFFFRE